MRLESAFPQVTRYMVVVSTNGRQDTEESIVLGMDFVSSDRSVSQKRDTCGFKDKIKAVTFGK